MNSGLIGSHLCKFQYIWIFVGLFEHLLTFIAQRHLAPIRPSFSPWPFWNHFLENDSAFFIVCLLLGPGSPQLRPSSALTSTLKLMPMILNLRWGTPRYKSYILVAKCFLCSDNQWTSKQCFLLPRGGSPVLFVLSIFVIYIYVVACALSPEPM